MMRNCMLPTTLGALLLSSSAIAQSNCDLNQAPYTECVSLGNGSYAMSRSVAIGAGAQANSSASTAIGFNARVDAHNGVAIGSGSYASGVTMTTFSFLGGNYGAGEMNIGNRRITGVDAGGAPDDAVNVQQLRRLGEGVVEMIGGGASLGQYGFSRPTFSLQGTTYSNVGDAFKAVDLSLTDIKSRIDTIASTPGPKGDSAYQVAVSNGYQGSESDWLDSLKGATGPAGGKGEAGTPGKDGVDGVDGSDGKDGVKGDTGAAGKEAPEAPATGGKCTDESCTTVNMSTASGTPARVTGLNDGVDGSDAVNVQQMKNEAAGAVRSANSYTDQRINELSEQWNDRWSNLDSRVNRLGREMERLGAMSSALTMMAGSSVDSQATVSAQVGLGFYGSRAAIAVGLKARLSDRSGMSFGISQDGSKAMGGVGVSFDLK